jgi:IS30 family transposase
MYSHLTQEDRISLSALLRAGLSQAGAARQLGKDPSAISRELGRNSKENGSYHAIHATKLSRERRKISKFDSRKIENNPKLIKKIESILDPLTSPEAVSWDTSVSHETIYAWIYRSRPDLILKLPYQGKKRRIYGSKRGKKQGWAQNMRPIESRPKGATNRSRRHHWEGDTAKGKNGAVLTHIERKSRFFVADLLPNEKASITYEKTNESLLRYEPKSITYDRGSSFALWRMTEKALKTKVYGCNPHCFWEKGTVENTIGRLRRVFPKKFDFSTITQEDLDKVVWKMNHTKRKCLGRRTPCEVFGKCCTSNLN